MASHTLGRQSHRLHVSLHNMAQTLKKDVYAEAGWTEASGSYDNGAPVAMIATIQEYGANIKVFGKTPAVIPPRPFVRPTVRQFGAQYVRFAQRGIIAAMKKGASPLPVMAMLAERVAGDLKKAILAVFEPPLAPLTIELRRRRWANAKSDNGYGNILTKPLIDTGRMINSVETRSGTK